MEHEWDVEGRLKKAIEKYKKDKNFQNPEQFKQDIAKLKPSLTIKYTDKINDDGQYHSEERTVLINKLISYTPRQNFTFYHEFTHYLMAEVDGFQDIFEFLHETIQTKKDMTKVIERLCNVGASEFLIDEQTQMAVRQAGIETVNRVKKLVDGNSSLSIPALAWKIADTRTVPMVVIIIHNGINHRKKGSQVVYPYIEYSFNTEGFKYPVWGNLPKDHLLKRGVEEGFDLEGDESTFPFSSNTKMPCYIVGYRHTQDRYLAFLYQHQEFLVPPEQQSLLPF